MGKNSSSWIHSLGVKLTLMCFHHGGFSSLPQAVLYQWCPERATHKGRKITLMWGLLLCLKLLEVKAELVRAFKSICSLNPLKSSLDFVRLINDLSFSTHI